MNIEELAELEKALEEGRLGLNDPAHLSATPAIAAAKAGDLEALKIFIRWKIDINQINSQGHTVLTMAIFKEKLDIIDFLLQTRESTGLDLSPKGSELSRTPLVEAVQAKNLPLIRTLLSLGIEINSTDHKGCAPLFRAASDLSMTEFFLDSGANPDFGKFNGITGAVWSENSEVFERLVRAGANIHYEPHDASLIHYAAQGDKISMIPRLIELGLSIDSRGAPDNCTPLHIAALYGSDRVIDFFLKNGAKVDALDNDGFTPLALAILGENRKRNTANAVSTLIRAGANVNHVTHEVTNRKQPLLHYAIDLKAIHSLRLLIENGADIESETPESTESKSTPESPLSPESGDTPLILAIKKGKIEIVGELLGAQADLLHANRAGKNALNVRNDSNDVTRLVKDWHKMLTSRDIEEFLDAKGTILPLLPASPTREKMLKVIQNKGNTLFYQTTAARIKSRKRKSVQCISCQNEKSLHPSEVFGKGPAGCDCYLCEDECRKTYAEEVRSHLDSEPQPLKCPEKKCGEFIDPDYFRRLGWPDFDILKLNRRLFDQMKSEMDDPEIIPTPE